MKNYAKVMLLVAAAFVLMPALAWAADEAAPGATPAPPSNTEPGAPPAGGPPAGGRLAGGPNMAQAPNPEINPLFPILESAAFKEEMARHKKAVEDIMAPLKPINEKLAADIKALTDVYFPKPVEGQPWERPAQEKTQEFADKIKALVEKYQTDNEAALKEVGGKLYDESITHWTNVLNIAKDNKDAILAEQWKKLLPVPQIRDIFRDVMQRMWGNRGPGGGRGGRNGGGNGGGNPGNGGNAGDGGTEPVTPPPPPGP
jgi:hypothetical protein